MFTDSHTHLNSPQLYPERGQHLADFVEQGGVGLSIIGTNLEDSLLAVQIAHEGKKPHPNLKIGACVGIHPEFAEQGISQIQELENLYLQYKDVIIGIGEIGTDLYREQYRPYHDKQLELFELQCKLAQKYNLPVVIHSRSDFDGSFQVVKKFPDLKVYFHCRGYTTKELEILHSWKLATGNRKLFVGFCGNITYPKAQELRDCFQYCLDHDIKVLLETDAPYLAAQAIRGQQNTPANIIYTYDYVSDYFQIQKDKLKELTYNNFMELYFE